MTYRAYEFVLNSKHDEYQRRLASIAYKFLDKKIGSGVRENANEMLAEEICKPLIKKC